jgi:hypothetical protein
MPAEKVVLPFELQSATWALLAATLRVPSYVRGVAAPPVDELWPDHRTENAEP